MLRSVAFGGGGMRGILHAGAYRALCEQNPEMTFPNGIYGCSIGCAMAIAASYRLTAEQIETLCLRHMTVKSVLEQLSLDNLQSLVEKRGLLGTDYFAEKMALAFDECGINLRTMTMDDLPQKTYFVSSNLTSGRVSLLSGKVPVLKALACSCCLPFLFVPEVLNGDIHVDGGVFVRSLREIVPPDTLVVHISRIDSSVTPTKGSIWEIVTAMVRGPKSKYFGRNVLRIDNRTISMLDDLTDEQKKAAVEDAYSQARAFFAKRLAEELK
jgi:predicted acylesterase/phospholipase RssA